MVGDEKSQPFQHFNNLAPFETKKENKQIQCWKIHSVSPFYGDTAPTSDVRTAVLWLMQNYERCAGKVLNSLRSRFSLTEAEAWTAIILFFGWKRGGAAHGLLEE